MYFADCKRFFCTDCKHLLGDQVLQLQIFYNQILDQKGKAGSTNQCPIIADSIMASNSHNELLGEEHDCYFDTDPRVNNELSNSLRGKNVIIAGAGRGIGRACALFLTHASAKSLSLMALELEEVERTSELCRQINPDIEIKVDAFDVKDYPRVDAFVKEADTAFGGIHVLLMNAGRPGQWLPTADCDPELWWDTVAVSLQGSFNFARSVLPVMQKQQEGRIIFTSSSGAHSNFGMSGYVLGKLGLVRLCEIIHHENFKDYNVKSFAFNPGCVQTRFITDFRDRVEGRTTNASYVTDGALNEDKSAQTAVDALRNAVWDTPELSAGLTTVIAAGKLDFMSGRYLDASKNIAAYKEEEFDIKKQDLHRVRLHVGPDKLIPKLDY